MFGKKKTPLRDYCLGTYDRFFSLEYNQCADSLIAKCSKAYSEGIDRDWYLTNFRAALMELLSIVFSRTLRRDQRYDVFDYEEKFLNSRGTDELGDLKHQYNSAFGSDPMDGIRPMAAAFTTNCAVDGVDPAIVTKVHYEAFYDILRTLFDNLKKIKLT